MGFSCFKQKKNLKYIIFFCCLKQGKILQNKSHLIFNWKTRQTSGFALRQLHVSVFEMDPAFMCIQMDSFYPPLHYHGLLQSVIWERLQTNSLNEPNLFRIQTDWSESLLGTSVSKDFLCLGSELCFAASDGRTNDALCLRCSSFDSSVSHCLLENV